MGAISPVHLVVVLIIALIVIGPSKLPETGAALGKAIREFREAASGADETAAEDSKTEASEPNQ
jgi:sec-independent protein translocase protein TatA